MNRLTLLACVALVCGAWVLSPAVVKYIDYRDNCEIREVQLQLLVAKLRAEHPDMPPTKL